MSGHVDTFVRDNLPPRDQWPELRFTLPELQFPSRYNVSSMLDRAIAHGHGANAALLDTDETLSYAQLLAHVNRTARALLALGVKPGNRVLLHVHNSSLSLVLWWAVWRIGAVAVGAMPMLRWQELQVIADKAQVTHAILSDALDLPRDARLPATTLNVHNFCEEWSRASEDFLESTNTAPDDPALIAFTSGTTGQPKGCVHFHRDIAAMAETFSRHILQPRPTDVFVGTPPLAFTFGLGAGVIFPASVGAATAVCPKAGFDVLADTIAQHKATTLFTSPTGYRALMKQDLGKLVSLHTCVSAGEHLPQATSDQWFERTGIRLIDGIGATEMIHIFISARGDDIRPGATGKPVPGYDACLLGDDNRPLSGAATGRLAVRGPTGCRYLADVRQRDYVIDGWNVTGDLYRRDDEGYYWYVSRADDMIVSSGYNIAAPEV